MAEIKRFSNKTEITNGNTEDYLSLNDVLISQHVTGDNEDKKALLSTVKATIYGISTTAESTATKVVTLQNFPADFNLYVGFTVLVHFNNANKATTQLYLQIGSLDAQPATVHGQNLTGAFPAGTELEFTWTGSHFNTSDFAISALDTTNVLPLNSTAVNGALADYTKSKTVTVTLGEYDTDTQIDVTTLGFTASPKLHVCGITAQNSENNRYLQLIVGTDIKIYTQYIPDNNTQTLRYTILNSNYAGKTAYINLSY